MAGGPRAYGAGVERALYRLARGSCYYPDCAQRVIVAVEGTPIVAVEIAHIRGAKLGSARYDAAMTDEERAAFANLILLCSAHHKLVDRIRPEDFSVEVLESWKQANEPEDGIEALAASGLTDNVLDEVIEEVVTRLGPMREVEVDLLAGVVMNGREVASIGDLTDLRTLLEINENLLTNPRVLVANIRNTGALPASVEGVDLWLVIGEEADNTVFSLVGRNDFGSSNPPLPQRLRDGDAVRWFTKVETMSAIVAAARTQDLTVTGIRARVNLGSGEVINSALLAWIDLD